MTPLHTFIQEEKAAAAALAVAMAQHKDTLQIIYKPIQVLCERYETLFKPIQYAAQSLTLAIPELDAENLPNNNRWGNQGLNSLVHQPNGFTQINTNDYFRNEWDVFRTLIPSKYLGADGAALMEADALRIQGELDVLKAAKSIEAAACLAVAEREELERLREKYNES